jgi:hypothetical protein
MDRLGEGENFIVSRLEEWAVYGRVETKAFL